MFEVKVYTSNDAFMDNYALANEADDFMLFKENGKENVQ